MSLPGDILRVAMSDLYYLKRNLPILMATSLVTPVLYLVAWKASRGADGRMVAFQEKR